MNFDEKLFAELDRINRKLDRLNSVVTQLPTTHNTDLGDWLNESQAKELLGYGTTSLWGLRKTGKIESSKIGGKTFYKRESIIQYLDKHAKKGTRK